jgi:hypothetical protein
MSNIQITQTETPNIVVTVDRGVAGVGIESVAIVYQAPDYFLEFTYTDGTTELVQLPAIATGVISFNTRIGAVTLTSTDVTGALGYTPPTPTGTGASGTWNISVSGNAGTVTNGVYTTDTGTVTNTMLAGSIANNKLVNSAITINGNSTSLGGSVNVGTVTSVAATAGTGISVSGSPITGSGTLSITNTAPDQTVVLTAGTGISTSGTYPNFTITNTSPSLGGDVVGAASSTDNAITRFNGTTGKLIQNSAVIIDDTDNVTGVNSLTATTLVVNDNATLGGSNTDSLAVNARITTDLEPETNNARDIGTNGRNWRDGFFGRNLQTVNFSSTGSTTLGDATADLITANGRFNTDLVPSTDNARDLGTSALKWKQIYATTFTENGSPVVVQTDIGTAPNEIPLNQYLGNLAYQDAANIAGNVGVGGALTLNSGTPIGVAYLNASKALTTGSALTFDGARFTIPSSLLVTSSQSFFGDSGVISGGAADGNTTIRYFGGKHLAFNEGASERMRISSGGNLGIGTTPNASAILDVQSTTKGVRMPNMTTTQKNAIASPAAGLMVFDTTLSKLSVYSGVAWETITSV